MLHEVFGKEVTPTGVEVEPLVHHAWRLPEGQDHDLDPAVLAVEIGDDSIEPDQTLVSPDLGGDQDAGALVEED